MPIVLHKVHVYIVLLMVEAIDCVAGSSYMP